MHIINNGHINLKSNNKCKAYLSENIYEFVRVYFALKRLTKKDVKIFEKDYEYFQKNWYVEVLLCYVVHSYRNIMGKELKKILALIALITNLNEQWNVNELSNAWKQWW